LARLAKNKWLKRLKADYREEAQSKSRCYPRRFGGMSKVKESVPGEMSAAMGLRRRISMQASGLVTKAPRLVAPSIGSAGRPGGE
jgi:hypothetical protein